MSNIFDVFENYGSEMNKPDLEEGQTYPAVLVDGPSSNDMLPYLHVKNGAKGVSAGLWFTFAVSKNGEPEFHERLNLLTVRQYVFLGHLDTRGETDVDRIKAGFLRGDYGFVGSPSTNLRNLRYALFNDAELEEMGPVRYDFDAFKWRIVNVVATNADNPSGGKPYTNIKRFMRHTNIMGDVGASAIPQDVAWSKKEEASEGLF